METVGVMCKNFTLFLLETFGSFGGIIVFIIFGTALLLVSLALLYSLSVLEKYLYMDKEMRRYSIHSKKVAVRHFYLSLRFKLKEFS